MSTPCPTCATPLRSTAKFCNQCGTKLAASEKSQTHTYSFEEGQPPGGPTTGGTQVDPAPGPQPSNATVIGSTALDGNQREHTVVASDISGSTAEVMKDGHQKRDGIDRSIRLHVKDKGQIDADDEVALVTFNNRAKLQLPLGPIHSNLQKLVQVTRNLKPDGGTNFHAALKESEKAFRWDVTNVQRKVVFVSDGLDKYPASIVERLKHHGVIIYVIGVGSAQNVDEKVLRKMASTVNGELLFERVEDFSSLAQTFTEWSGKTRIS